MHIHIASGRILKVKTGIVRLCVFCNIQQVFKSIISHGTICSNFLISSPYFCPLQPHSYLDNLLIPLARNTFDGFLLLLLFLSATSGKSKEHHALREIIVSS